MTTPVIDLRTRAKAAGSWLGHAHPDYTANYQRWRFAADHYSGRVLDDLSTYLVKRLRGESRAAFDERAQLADYTNHFGAVVDSIAGMLFAVEGDANRTFGDLGDPADGSSPAARLLDDGWMTAWKELATQLLVNHRAWVLVDAGDGDPRVKIYPVTAVPNWLGEAGRDSVVIEEVADTRSRIEDDPRLEQRWLVFRPEGWTRYKIGEGDKPEVVEAGPYSFQDRAGNPALPIFLAELPLNRMVGWQLAKKANAMFNMESTRDFLLRVANFPKLNLVANDTLFDKMVEALDQGSNVLQNDPHQTTASAQHSYIAPSAESATVATDVLKRKVEEFYIAAFRMYGDSAKEKTATESRQDVSQGVGAFLQMLKAAIDRAEGEAMWRAEQVHFPNERTKWFKARVERSDDFVPSDVDHAIDKLRERYFGTAATVPVGRTAMIEAVRTIAGWDGVRLDEAEVEAAVDARLLQEAFTASNGMFDIPPEAAVQLVLKVLIASGIIKEGEVEMADGTKRSVAQVVEREARAAAEAKAEAARREGESFPAR